MALNPRRIRLLGLLVGLLMLVTALPVAASHADEPGDVRVELTSISPTTLSGAGELVISGRVTNQSEQPLNQLTVQLWRDATPITTLTRLDAVQAEGQSAGEVMQSADAVTTIGTAGTLEAGESAEFTVRADLSADAAEQSWLSQPDAAYQVGVQVFAGPVEVGGACTLIAYPGQTQADIGTIVLMNARPSLLPLESAAAQVPVFADDSLETELETRLAQLLRLSEQDDVLVVIDPQLYDEVAQLALLHAVRLPDGSHSEPDSSGSALAQAWLDAVDALASSGRAYRSLYGSLDIAQAVASGQQALVAQSATLPAGHPLEALPLVVVPFSGLVDQPTVAALQTIAPSYVLVSNLGDQLRHDAFGLQILSVDPASAAQPENPVQDPGAVLARQLVAGNQGSASIQLVSTQAQAELALADYSWRHRRSVADLIGQTISEGIIEWPENAAPADDELARASSQTTELLATWHDLIELPDGAADGTDQVLPSAWSTTFERATSAQTDWLGQASEPAGTVITGPDAIQLRISDWVTTSEDNLLPVTVINNTNFQVSVRIEFDSDNPLRISVPESDPITVQPGESAAVRVTPVTEGNGIVAMRARMVTAEGHPVGAPSTFTVTGTGAGRVAWIIIVASGAVLLGATAYRVRSMRRENRED